MLFNSDYCSVHVLFGARYVVIHECCFVLTACVVHVRSCCDTAVLCILSCLFMICLSLLNYFLIFCYIELYLHFLFLLIYLLLFAYFDGCTYGISLANNLPRELSWFGSRSLKGLVKFSCATLGAPTRYPYFPFCWGLRDLRVHKTGSRAWLSSGIPKNFFLPIS